MVLAQECLDGGNAMALNAILLVSSSGKCKRTVVCSLVQPRTSSGTFPVTRTFSQSSKFFPAAFGNVDKSSRPQKKFAM